MRFQFHSGSIKRYEARAREAVTSDGFNSIVVRLKGADGPPPATLVRSFNSIVVRLKGQRGLALRARPIWFQFHSGSIKREKQASKDLLRIQVSIP